MLFAIDRINDDQNLLKNIKLGALILDTCSSDTYALNQSLEFIRASINTVEASAFQCRDGSTPKTRFGLRHITGVVGGSYSEVSSSLFTFQVAWHWTFSSVKSVTNLIQNHFFFACSHFFLPKFLCSIWMFLFDHLAVNISLKHSLKIKHALLILKCVENEHDWGFLHFYFQFFISLSFFNNLLALARGSVFWLALLWMVIVCY